MWRRFAEVVDPIRPDLWRSCLRLTGSAWDAEDLVQETLLRAFARLAQYWQPIEPRSYLFRIATHAWIDSLRRARLPVDSLQDHPEPGSEGEADPAATWAAMETLVALLPPRQRVVVLLTQVFDFTAREVAAMLATSEGAVKAALHRARQTLRQEARAVEEAPVERRIAAPNQVVARYLDALRRRDPDAICALLADDVTHEIIGVSVEEGVAEVRRNSLAGWAAHDPPMWAEPGRLDGRDAIFVYLRTPEHMGALTWIVTAHVAGGRITRLHNYCFCPDLIQYAAARLGVPTFLYGYRYTPPAAPKGGA